MIDDDGSQPHSPESGEAIDLPTLRRALRENLGLKSTRPGMSALAPREPGFRGAKADIRYQFFVPTLITW